MVNRTNLFPSDSLREKLSRLGVPQAQQNVQSLEEMMPIPVTIGSEYFVSPDAMAARLIYLISNGIIRIPQSMDQVLESLLPGTHLCQFYSSQQDLAQWMVAYYKKGLANNEQCVFIASEEFSLFEAHKTFSEAIPGFDQHLRAGRMAIISYKDYYLDISGELKEPCDLIQAPPQREEEALSKGFTGLRGAADLSWLREKDWAKFMEYEHLVDTVIQNSRITGLCVYPVTTCKADQLSGAAHSHPVVYSKRNHWCHRIEKSEYVDSFLKSMKEACVTE